MERIEPNEEERRSYVRNGAIAGQILLSDPIEDRWRHFIAHGLDEGWRTLVRYSPNVLLPWEWYRARTGGRGQALL